MSQISPLKYIRTLCDNAKSKAVSGHTTSFNSLALNMTSHESALASSNVALAKRFTVGSY